jgi:ATP-dependent RNA helicase DDX49/DBP8
MVGPFLISNENYLTRTSFISEKEVGKIITQVSVTRRESEIKLDETDFYEKKELNKRKQLMLEGKDPDEEIERKDKYKKKMRKQKIRAAIKAREERKKKREQEKSVSVK